VLLSQYYSLTSKSIRVEYWNYESTYFHVGITGRDFRKNECYNLRMQVRVDNATLARSPLLLSWVCELLCSYGLMKGDLKLRGFKAPRRTVATKKGGNET
jgi:hypothetical protein